MPFARDLHPEFGYVGSAPRLFRRLGLVLSFIVFGLVAGASGVAVFVADPDPDPMHAMALAPAEALVGATSSSSAAVVETKAAQAPLAQKTSRAVAVKSPCRENSTELFGGDCTPARAARSRPIQAVNERPAIAAVSIGHRDDPAVLPPEPAIPVAAMPETSQAAATPAKAAPAAVAARAAPAPAVASRKARTRNQHAEAPRRQRDRNEYSSSSRYSYQNSYQSYQSNTRGGYAGIW